jgi:hypothetical protein
MGESFPALTFGRSGATRVVGADSRAGDDAGTWNGWTRDHTRRTPGDLEAMPWLVHEVKPRRGSGRDR